MKQQITTGICVTLSGFFCLSNIPSHLSRQNSSSLQVWYSQQVKKNIRKKIAKAVDTKMSIMKRLGAKWLEMLYNYL